MEKKTITLAQRSCLFTKKPIPPPERNPLFAQKAVPRGRRKRLFLPEFDLGTRQFIGRSPRRVCGTGRKGEGAGKFAGRVREIGYPLDRSDLADGGTPLLSSPRTQPPPPRGEG